jgi:hypothetical protein
MVDTRPHELNGLAKKTESPAVASRVKCPNCGREPAIVFPLIREYYMAVKDTPLVCLECCPAARGRR